MDWSGTASPQVTTAYATYTTDMRGRDIDLVKGLDPAKVTITNPLTDSIRWNSANRKWEMFNGTSWVAAIDYYAIEVGAFTGDVTKAAGASALTIGANKVLDTMLRDSTGLSVIGRAANSSGDPADIAAAADDRVLARVASALSWTQLTAGMFPANIVTNAKLAQVATQTFKGRNTAGTGDPEDLSVATAKALLNLANTNNGDQTITLTGDVSGSGGGSFAATLASIITAGGPTGSGTVVPVITWDAKGRLTAVGTAGITIPAASVAQGNLKTTTGEVTTASTTGVNLTLPGGEYGFYPSLRVTVSDAIAYWGADGSGVGKEAASSAATPYATLAFLSCSSAGRTTFMQQRYVQASPPYNLGDGEVPLFVFALADALGKIIATYVAADPPWANNGPTNIRADFFDKIGRGFRVERPKVARGLLLNPATRGAALAALDAPHQIIEITQAMKQADMPLIPHPFQCNDLTGLTVVLLDPVSALTERLLRLHDGGESIGGLLYEDHLRLDNAPLVRAGPAGVMPVAPRWKLT